MRPAAGGLALLVLGVLGVCQAMQAPCSYDDPESCGNAGGAARIVAAAAGEEPAKAEWPELLGKPAREARTVIEAERPEITVQVVPPGSAVTMEWREDRVRLWVNDDAKVTRVPVIG